MNIILYLRNKSRIDDAGMSLAKFGMVLMVGFGFTFLTAVSPITDTLNDVIARCEEVVRSRKESEDLKDCDAGYDGLKCKFQRPSKRRGVRINRDGSIYRNPKFNSIKYAY